jgi:lysophospholipase L1-like esterase
MVRNRCLALAAALLVGSAAGCSDQKVLLTAPAPGPGGERFTSYVAIGNSITAGYQSGGILDSTQRQSYARLLAVQAGTRYAYAALAGRGCAPPIVNFQTQERFGHTAANPVTSTTCDLRAATSVNAVLNNVGVPGATSLDPTSTSTAASNALTTFILGGKTQVQKALEADPTFVSVWIGNNDVLDAAVRGRLQPTPGLTLGVTPTATFITQYDATLTALEAGATRLQGGVLIGVVDVRNAPIMFPAAALFNTAFKAGFDQFAGGTVTIHPSCTPTTTSLLSFAIIAAMRAGQHPLTVACEPDAIPGTPVGDYFVLDAAEQSSLATIINDYNTHIQAKATELGFAYYDPNTLLTSLRATGDIPTVPNLASATAPYGAYVTLDGVHPSKLAHRAIANALIAVINTKYSLTIPAVP